MSWMIRLGALLAVMLSGCGEGTTPLGDSGLADAGAIEDGGAGGPTVFVHLRSTHASVAHDPATQGQTPRAWSSGVRSLQLLRSMDDTAPVTVFDHGDDFVEAGYEDGADTVVGMGDLSVIPSGVYTHARVVHTHVRFTIDATVHSVAGSFPGELEDLIVLSDRTTLDGVVRSRGDFDYVLRAAGMEFPYSGSGFYLAPIASGGFWTEVEAGETAYYFAAPVVVSEAVSEDQHFIFEVNMHEGFRWVDEEIAGYSVGVFDMTPVSTEPIVQAGANSFAYSLEASP